MKKILILSLFILMFFPENVISQFGKGPADIDIITQDGITISAGYQYPKDPLKLIPVIILIHQGGSSRIEWLELPLWNKLLEEGYALLAYDVRMHGKSSKDEGDLMDLFNNPNRAPLDLLAVIKFLEKDKKIDPNRIGILGASIGANLGVVAASMDKYHIRSVVSLSAKTSAVQSLSGMKEEIRPNNVFYIASENEQNGLREKWAYELFDKTTGKREIEIAKGDKHGSYILRKSKFLENRIMEWFELTL